MRKIDTFDINVVYGRYAKTNPHHTVFLKVKENVTDEEKAVLRKDLSWMSDKEFDLLMITRFAVLSFQYLNDAIDFRSLHRRKGLMSVQIRNKDVEAP